MDLDNSLLNKIVTKENQDYVDSDSCDGKVNTEVFKQNADQLSNHSECLDEMILQKNISRDDYEYNNKFSLGDIITQNEMNQYFINEYDDQSIDSLLDSQNWLVFKDSEPIELDSCLAEEDPLEISLYRYEDPVCQPNERLY